MKGNRRRNSKTRRRSDSSHVAEYSGNDDGETHFRRSGKASGATVASVRHFGGLLARALVGLTYPPRCLGCGDRLFEASALLCVTCFLGIDRASAMEVQARLRRLPQAEAALDRVACLWIFDKGGAMQAVHQALKYGNRPSYGITLGGPIGAMFLEEFAGAASIDLIIPIPLHQARLYERGYNQSAMLAYGAAKVIGRPVLVGTLIRPRPTRTQTALQRSSRWENLVGAFRVTDPAAIAGRNLLLIDDVLTTGSTAGAAAKVLREAGATRVDLAALALART